MRYYIIEEFVDPRFQVARPLFITEKEEIAKDIIKRYRGLTYSIADTKEETE